MKNAMTEIKKLDPQAAAQKVAELRKEIFENRQKLIRGEFKDVSFFKKKRREIARLLSVAVKNAVIAVPKSTAPKKVVEKVEKAEKVAKPKKVKEVRAVVAEATPGEAPKKTKKTKAKKEEK
jgi:ribosomal protein L29